MRKFIITFAFVLIMCVTAFGDDDNSVIFKQHMENFDFEDINYYSEQNVGMSIEELMQYIVLDSGDISVTKIFEGLTRVIFSEIYSNSDMMKSLIIICILSGIILTISNSLKDSSIAQMGFYINYIMVANILFTSYYISLGILKDVIHNILNIIRSALPLTMGMMIAGGNSASAYAFNPVMLIVVDILGGLIDNVVTPFITFSVIVHILNNISEKEMLSKMAELFKQFSVWSLRGVSIIFMGVISFYKISTPILNSAVNKTAKSAIGMLPVVGDVFTGSVDMALYWINAIKSGFGLGLVVIIVGMSILPIIKILASILIYKFTAAIIQPIADSRITDVIDCMGGYTAIILSSLITVIIMFVFSILMMLSSF